MKITREICRFVKRQWSLVAIGLAVMVEMSALSGDIHLSMLKTRTDSFTNVTVYSRSRTDIFIRHSRGIANVKLENLDPETIARLNSGDAPGRTATSTKPAVAAKESELSSNATNTTASISYSNLNVQLRQQVMSGLGAVAAFSSVRLTPNVLTLIVASVLAVHWYFCFCLKLICQKAGAKPGVLIWIPIVQMFPLLRAAGMSGWWFLGFMIPGVNLIALLLWSFKIVQKRGKSVWVAIGLLLPVTNLVALLYLAFSGGNDGQEQGRRVAVTGPPLPTEA